MGGGKDWKMGRKLTWKLDTATRNTVQLKLTQLGLANRLTFILNTLDIKFKLNL